jgi:hypothetical protein
MLSRWGIIRIIIGIIATLLGMSWDKGINSLALLCGGLWVLLTSLRNLLVDVTASRGFNPFRWDSSCLRRSKLANDLFVSGLSLTPIILAKKFGSDLPCAQFGLGLGWHIVVDILIVSLVGGVLNYLQRRARGYPREVARVDYFRSLAMSSGAYAIFGLLWWKGVIPNLIAAPIIFAITRKIIGEVWGGYSEFGEMRRRHSAAPYRLDEIGLLDVGAGVVLVSVLLGSLGLGIHAPPLDAFFGFASLALPKLLGLPLHFGSSALHFLPTTDYGLLTAFAAAAGCVVGMIKKSPDEKEPRAEIYLPLSPNEYDRLEARKRSLLLSLANWTWIFLFGILIAGTHLIKSKTFFVSTVLFVISCILFVSFFILFVLAIKKLSSPASAEGDSNPESPEEYCGMSHLLLVFAPIILFISILFYHYAAISIRGYLGLIASVVTAICSLIQIYEIMTTLAWVNRRLKGTLEEYREPPLAGKGNTPKDPGSCGIFVPFLPLVAGGILASPWTSLTALASYFAISHFIPALAYIFTHSGSLVATFGCLGMCAAAKGAPRKN